MQKTGQGYRADLVRNTNEVKKGGGSESAGYTIDRLHREAPELYEQVCAGEKSANAAAIEIDENLMRSELKPTEYAEHMQRRQDIWEAMQAQAQPGGTTCSTRSDSGKFVEGNDGGGQGFAEATAKATGKTKQDTNRAIRRAREVCQQARDIIRNTRADTGTGGTAGAGVVEAVSGWARRAKIRESS